MSFRILGIALVIVAIFVAVVPQFNNCTAQGLSLTTKDGKQIDMKCFWTARAELGVAIPLLAVGILVALNRKKGALLSLAVAGGLLSALVIALPTVLIGVCKMDKACLNIMQPSMILLGIVGIALSAAVAFLASRVEPDPVA